MAPSSAISFRASGAERSGGCGPSWHAAAFDRFSVDRPPPRVDTIGDLERDDHQLLEDARAGDRKALEELLDRNQQRIYRFGLKMCGNPEDAKDVLQETLLAMARGVGDFRGASSLSTWLYTIARSFCIKQRRRGRSVETTPGLEASELPQRVDTAPLPDERLAVRESHRALGDAIAALEPVSREVLLLRDGEGLTAPETAEVLGVSVDAVKSRLHRARVQVRAAMAPLVGDAPSLPGCPNVVDQLSRHMEGEISGEVCAAMERHLADCEPCRVRCDSLRATLELCRSTVDTEVPAPIQASVRAALRSLLAPAAPG